MLENAGLPGGYDRISPYVFMNGAHLTIAGSEAPKLGVDRTDWDTIFKSAIPDLHKMRARVGNCENKYTETLLAAHMEK